MNPRRPRSLARTWLGSVDLDHNIMADHWFPIQGLNTSFTFLYRFVHVSMLLRGRVVFLVHQTLSNVILTYLVYLPGTHMPASFSCYEVLLDGIYSLSGPCCHNHQVEQRNGTEMAQWVAAWRIRHFLFTCGSAGGVWPGRPGAGGRCSYGPHLVLFSCHISYVHMNIHISCMYIYIYIHLYCN